MARRTWVVVLCLIGLLIPAVPAVAAAGPTTAVANPAGAGVLTEAGLDQVTIPDLQRLMNGHRLSAVALTAAYLHRIDTVDKQKVHAVLYTNPLAIAEAARSDLRRATGHSRGQLEGIPILLKDNVDTVVDPTTAGSRALLGSRPARDATLVRKLRDAGAVILGKTNLSEWANFRSTHSTSGWSGVGGQTSNPYVLDRNPCGSSAGSGAAEAAALAQVSIGTETDGSVVCPSGANGIAGEKPTLGVVSRTGVIPISAQQDTAGPMARHVIDVAITLSALQGPDSQDPATLQIPANQPTDYAAALRPGALRGARIGVWRQAGADPDVDRVVQASVDTLKAQGATVVDVDIPFQNEVGNAEGAALLTEFRHDLEAYLATRPGGPDTLAQLIDFDNRDKVELSKFGQEEFTQSEAAPGEDDPGYQQARTTATTLARRSIDETLAAQHLDAIVSPTNSPAWKTDYAAGDAFVLGSSGPAAVAGYPNVSVPAGAAGPLPIGMSFFAGRWQDATVLSFAAGFEQATHAFRTPRYLLTLPAS